MAPSTTAPRPGTDSPFAAAVQSDPSLIWVGSVDNPSGYSDEMRGFLRTLEGAGYEPALRDVQLLEKRAGLSLRDRALFERQKGRSVNGPAVAVHHYAAVNAQSFIGGAVNVSRTMFETDSVPEARLGLLLDRDQIWVPCQFNVETFAHGGVPEEKLRVVGGTLEFDAYDPAAEPYPLDVPDGHFVFLTNFAFAERKGWKQLIRAWARAFGPDDGVCLVLKTHGEFRSDDFVLDRIESFLRDEYGPGARDRLAPMVVMTDMLATAQLPSLYAAADAYVLASRGEAWGRPYMEALTMGLPTIGSRWSGNLEFMHDGNSFLVDGEVVSCEQHAREVFGQELPGHGWFEPDIDDLADKLRVVAGDPAGARERAAGARAELIDRFGPGPTARRIAELAREAWEMHGDLRSRPTYAAIRGSFGSRASLAVVNDALSGELIARGHNVACIGGVEAPRSDAAPGITHSWPPNFDALTAGPTVAILPWEFGAPPRDWVDKVRSQVDRVWVPSEYVREGYVAAGMPAHSVEVVPNGVDLTTFTPDGPQRELPRTAACTFLFVGGTTWRKGADILIDAWRRAFGPDDDVQLVIKDFGTATHYRNQTAGDLIRAAADRDDIAPIVYFDDEVPFDELPELYRAADVLVVPYRGEGFCLPALEAMACGVPVIHNGSGPTREFVGEIGGWPVDAPRVPLPPTMALPDLAYEGYVHEVDPDALAERLRAVAADPAGRRARADAAHRQALGYGWDDAADVAERSLAVLREEGLPNARSIRRAEIEARTHYAVFAPDWADADGWRPVLNHWIATFGPDDDVTLALYAEGDTEAVGEMVMGVLAGRDEETLPDLALILPGSVPLVSLAATADAVIAYGVADPTARPELFRRARRVLSGADAIHAYAADIRGRAS